MSTLGWPVAGAAAFRPGANRLLVSFPSGDLVLQTYPEIHLEIYDRTRLHLDHVVRLSELQPATVGTSG